MSEKLGWDKDEYLYADEIAYYLFDSNKTNDRYTARQTKILKAGIPLKAFDQSVEEFYNDGITIEAFK